MENNNFAFASTLEFNLICTFENADMPAERREETICVAWCELRLRERILLFCIV